MKKTKTQGRAFDDKGVNNTLLALGYTTTQIGLMTTTQKTNVGVSLATGIVIPGRLTATGADTSTAPNTSQFADYVYYRYGSRVTREHSYDNALPVIQGRYQITKTLLLELPTMVRSCGLTSRVLSVCDRCGKRFRRLRLLR